MNAPPDRLRADHLSNPVGLPVTVPRLYWRSGDDRPAEVPTGWRVQAASSPEQLDTFPDLWDSGAVDGTPWSGIEYGGLGVEPRYRVWWRVCSLDSDGLASAWSEPAFFEFGLPEAHWRGQWIGVPVHGTRMQSPPVPLLRRRFRIGGEVRRARLYLAVAGACRVWINERELDIAEVPSGASHLPGCFPAVTVCVEDLVRQGANSLTVLLADGWYSGFIDGRTREHFGTRPRLLAQVEVDDERGAHVVVPTDDQWEWRTSPLVRADISRGASIDGRAFGGLGEYVRQKRLWLPVEVLADEKARPLAWVDDGVRALPGNRPGRVVRRQAMRAGERRWLVELPEPMLGRPRIKVEGEAGDYLRVRYAERLGEGGQPEYLAGVQDDYTLGGEPGGEVFSPPLVRHAARLLEITGDLPADGLLGVEYTPVGRVIPRLTVVHTDHPLLERLMSSYASTVQALVQEVPWSTTNIWKRVCDAVSLLPQIDAIAMHFDSGAVLKQLLVQFIADERIPAGIGPSLPPLARPPTLTPGIGSVEPAFDPEGGDLGRLGEVVLALADSLARYHGDRQALELAFPFLRRLVFAIETACPDLIRPLSSEYRRWPPILRDVLGTAFYHDTVCRVAAFAEALGHEEQAASFTSLARRVRQAFRRRFVTADGLLVTDAVEAYIAALSMGLLEEAEHAGAIARIVAWLDHHRYVLDIDPLLQGRLLDALVAGDRAEIAATVALQVAPGSWLAELVEQPATWIRHRGDADLATGIPVQWITHHLVGICPSIAEGDVLAGMRHVRIAPTLIVDDAVGAPPAVRYAELRFDSSFGEYLVRWRLERGEFSLHVCIPCGCSADVRLPDGREHRVVAGAHDFRCVLKGTHDDIPVLSEVL